MNKTELLQYADTVMLALVLWREARGEDANAKIGIAWVVRTRAEKPPVWWGKDILSVISCPLQFSSMTYPKDPQLTTWPKCSSQSWEECLSIASGVLSGTYKNIVPGADSYHDTSISPPEWAKKGKFIAQYGKVRFYQTV